jgi:predicted dehydrogenase
MYQYTYTFRNGCVAQVENGWITPNSNLSVNDFKCNIMGTKGMYNLDLSNHNLIQRFADTASTPDILVNNFVRETAAGFAYQSIRHFVDCMISGGPFYVSLEDAYNDTVTLLHVFESARTGKPVKVTGLL